MLTPEDVMCGWHEQAVRAKSPRAAYSKFTPRRVDKNQKAMVKVFRDLGAAVTHTHTVGKGFTDIVIAVQWLNCVVEIKDGSKPPSGRRLSPDEQTFFGWWPGLKAVCCNTEDAQAIVARMKYIVQQFNVTERQLGNMESQYFIGQK